MILPDPPVELRPYSAEARRDLAALLVALAPRLAASGQAAIDRLAVQIAAQALVDLGVVDEEAVDAIEEGRPSEMLDALLAASGPWSVPPKPNRTRPKPRRAR